MLRHPPRPDRNLHLIQVNCSTELTNWLREQADYAELPVSAYVRQILLAHYRRVISSPVKYACLTCGYARADQGPGVCANKRHCADAGSELQRDNFAP